MNHHSSPHLQGLVAPLSKISTFVALHAIWQLRPRSEEASSLQLAKLPNAASLS